MSSLSRSPAGLSYHLRHIRMVVFCSAAGGIVPLVELERRGEGRKDVGREKQRRNRRIYMQNPCFTRLVNNAKIPTHIASLKLITACPSYYPTSILETVESVREICNCFGEARLPSLQRYLDLMCIEIEFGGQQIFQCVHL